MPQTRVRTPRASAPGTPRGNKSYGRGCSRPRGRETAVEAEATQTRVAVEAEAGEIRAHALPTRLGGEGVRKTPYLSESERGKGVRRR